MTISLKHTFTSAKSDGADSTLVQPSNWNAEHTLTAAAGKVLGRDTSGAGAVQELPIAVDTSGNVGIGTATPGAKLNVAGSGKGTIFGSTSALNFYSAWQYNGADVGYIGNGAAVLSGAGASDFGIDAPGAHNLCLGTNDIERMRIDSSGKVGIGTTSPGQKLSVAGVIESTTGGVKFPDGTTQTTAATGGSTWTQIGTATPTVNSVTFSSIPQTYANLLLVIQGASHNAAFSNSTQLRVQASYDNGINTTTLNLLQNTSIQSTYYASGAFLIAGYTKPSMVFSGSSVYGFNSSYGYLGFTEVDDSSFLSLSAALNYLKIYWLDPLNSFDAGTVTLYGC